MSTADSAGAEGLARHEAGEPLSGVLSASQRRLGREAEPLPNADLDLADRGGGNCVDDDGPQVSMGVAAAVAQARRREYLASAVRAAYSSLLSRVKHLQQNEHRVCNRFTCPALRNPLGKRATHVRTSERLQCCLCRRPASPESETGGLLVSPHNY